jgi:predicted amidophosphoribosyltransferase
MFFFVRRDEPPRCPRCGQPATPSSSACALCGAALDPDRVERSPGPLERAAARWRELLAARRR